MLVFKGRPFIGFVLVILTFSSGAFAGETAVLAPDGSETSLKFAAAIENNLQKVIAVTDSYLAAAALKARNPENPFNLTAREAGNLGTAIGCSHYVLIKGGILRRSSFERKGFFEAFAAVYLIESRSGEMILWRLFNSERDDGASALEGLLSYAPEASAIIAGSIDDRDQAQARIERRENNEQFEEDENGLRAPLPYNRMKPRYTETADRYGVEATVDIEVSIDKKGRVAATRIVRWAGFGLDQSVEKTVREMNWRAADRRGKNLAMTVLLRYNFRDLNNPGSPP